MKIENLKYLFLLSTDRRMVNQSHIEFLLFTIFSTLMVYGFIVLPEYREFHQKYVLATFTVTGHQISNKMVYIKEKQDECQDARYYIPCNTSKKIGSCYDKGNVSCYGEYVWLDDWGYQVTDSYGEGGRNYYLRSINFRRTLWTLTTFFGDRNITYSTTNCTDIINMRKATPVGLTIAQYVYRETGEIPIHKINIYSYEETFQWFIVIEMILLLGVMFENT